MFINKFEIYYKSVLDYFIFFCVNFYYFFYDGTMFINILTWIYYFLSV